MQQKAWTIANTNIVSGLVSALGAAYFSHLFTKSYREQELKLLTKRNDELEEDCVQLRRDNDQLLSTNARVVSEFSILKNRFDDCRYESDHSWCFWKYRNPRSLQTLDPLTNKNESTLSMRK